MTNSPHGITALIDKKVQEARQEERKLIAGWLRSQIRENEDDRFYDGWNFLSEMAAGQIERFGEKSVRAHKKLSGRTGQVWEKKTKSKKPNCFVKELVNFPYPQQKGQ